MFRWLVHSSKTSYNLIFNRILSSKLCSIQMIVNWFFQSAIVSITQEHRFSNKNQQNHLFNPLANKMGLHFEFESMTAITITITIGNTYISQNCTSILIIKVNKCYRDRSSHNTFLCFYRLLSLVCAMVMQIFTRNQRMSNNQRQL